jgi:isopenicillin-N N-acyltransferase like protein
MIARHTSAEEDPRKRGVGIGRAQAEAIRRTIAAYERLFAARHGLTPDVMRELGREVGETLGRGHPDLLAEIGGMADGSGTPVDSLLAINARTEILAGGGRSECSAIGVDPGRSGEETLLAQNWDWHPDLADSMVLWTVAPTGGRSFTTLTEAGILAKIGLNDRGLGLCLNILSTTRDGGIGGTPIHALCRLILDRAATLSDVQEILAGAGAGATASSCFNVGAAGGELASFELSPGGLSEVEPENGILLHTNHFLAPPGAGEDLMQRDSPDTGLRLAELDVRIRQADRPLDAEAITTALRSHEAGPIAVCCHDADNPAYEDRVATLASVVMNLERRELRVTDGAPCVSDFEVV